MSPWVRSIFLALVLSLALSTTSHANGQVNRLIEWQDTNQLAYETNTILRHQGMGLSPCDTRESLINCDPASNTLTIINVLGPCFTDPKFPCIEEVSLKEGNGPWLKGIHSGERTPARTWGIWPKDFLPGLDSPRANNLFIFPGFRHSKGQFFEVSPVINIESINGKSLDYKSIRLNAFPVYQEAERGTTDPRECLNMVEMFNSPAERCWRKNSETEGWELSVSLRLPSSPHGWATGRIADISIVTETISGSAMPLRLTVTGKPMQVPMLTRSFLREDPKDFEEWNKIAPVFNLPWDEISRGPALGPGAINSFLSLIEAFPPFDKATGERLAWVIDFTWVADPGISQEISRCSSKPFIGYAGSNALTFENAIPKFDLKSSTLEYAVASPHYKSDGSEATGRYHLVIDTDLSRCLWRVTGSVASASISVTDTSGSSKVATASMVEKKDFTYFTAAGFSFSKSKISVKLFDQGGATKTPAPSNPSATVPETKAQPGTQAKVTPKAAPTKADKKKSTKKKVITKSK